MNVTDIERKIMGLAAGQARLLSITGRKSDCEFQSMRLSHQKIALARELADLSNEYQDSLSMTKLVYDYYGTGDTSMPLSYSLMMSPSALNDYMPILVTDSLGRVTLNSKLAAAARAAGIPQEGLGCLPSEVMRNQFIAGLADQELITSDLADRIMSLPYNQQAGFGGGTTVATNYTTGDVNELIDMLKKNGSNVTIDISRYQRDVKDCKKKDNTVQLMLGKGNDLNYDKLTREATSVSLADLLSDTEQYYIAYCGVRGEQSPMLGLAMAQDYLADPGNFLDILLDEFSSILDIGDGYSAAALDYAYNATKNLLVSPEVSLGDKSYQEVHDYWANHQVGKGIDEATSWKDHKDTVQGYIGAVGTDIADKTKYDPNTVKKSNEYIGFTTASTSQQGWHDDGYDRGTAGLNLNNVAKSFLTYFADYMNGISKTDKNGIEVFDVNIGHISESHLATDNFTFMYNLKTGKDVSSDDLGQATFYDTLFNQICADGWTENNRIEENDYLREMLQSGMQHISKVKDDGYYYQGNYATDSYIKEVADETAIAQAEARYSTEKAKLNAKEETIDMKMKNLDTEISSLTTEYDTVKSTISKNIEKSFKRYNA